MITRLPTFRGANSNKKYSDHFRMPRHYWYKKNTFTSYEKNSSVLTNPELPVIDWLTAKANNLFGSAPLTRTALMYVNHPFYTSFNLYKAIEGLGIEREHTGILGKRYSECRGVIDKFNQSGVHYQLSSAQAGLGKFHHSFIRDIVSLWSTMENKLNKKEIDNVLILDHGGYALALAPPSILDQYRVVGIEKTTAGLINPNIQGLTFPIIEVASCTAKRELESPLIAESVVDKLTPLIPIQNKKLVCGVIGYGAIGKAVTNKLLSLGHRVFVYDNNPIQLTNLQGAIAVNEPNVVIAYADYIFGCTGRDISVITDFFRACPHDKTLISCSSEDKEFLSLLQLIQQKQVVRKPMNPLLDIDYKTDFGATIKIIQGGFPINFDRSGDPIPSNDIQLTRALTLAGVIQAISFFKNEQILNHGGSYALDAGLQKLVVNEWLKYQPADRFPKSMIDQFQDVDWIASKSGGMRSLIPISLDNHLISEDNASQRLLRR